MLGSSCQNDRGTSDCRSCYRRKSLRRLTSFASSTACPVVPRRFGKSYAAALARRRNCQPRDPNRVTLECLNGVPPSRVNGRKRAERALLYGASLAGAVPSLVWLAEECQGASLWCVRSAWRPLFPLSTTLGRGCYLNRPVLL